MTIEEIRKNAPQGATHYDEVGCYFHKTNDRYFVYCKLTGALYNKSFVLTESQLSLYGIKPL